MHEMSRLPLNSLSKARAWPSRTSSGRTGAGRTSRVMPRLTARRRTWLARDDRSCPVAGPSADGVVGVSVLQAAADIVPAMPTAYQNFRIETSTGWDRSRPQTASAGDSAIGPYLRSAGPVDFRSFRIQLRASAGLDIGCRNASCPVRCAPTLALLAGGTAGSASTRREDGSCPKHLLQHVVARSDSTFALASGWLPHSATHFSDTSSGLRGTWPNPPAPTAETPAVAGCPSAAYSKPQPDLRVPLSRMSPP